MKTLILVIVLLVSIFSGCIGTNEKEMYYQDELNDTIVLYPDNTFTLVRPAKYDVSGTYKIDSGKLILVFAPFGTTYTYKKESNRLVDPTDGSEWRRI